MYPAQPNHSMTNATLGISTAVVSRRLIDGEDLLDPVFFITTLHTKYWTFVKNPKVPAAARTAVQGTPIERNLRPLGDNSSASVDNRLQQTVDLLGLPPSDRQSRTTKGSS